jgi:enoyl-CoA hydratase/carnithine racemase
MADENPVLCERDGPVGIVRLNRPEKHNAINRALSLELGRIIQELEADESIRAIVLTGAGEKAFCAGADMGERVDAMDRRGEAAGAPQQQPAGVDGYGAVARATKPVIAAINGYAFGGGALLASHADIRLASTTATIRFVGASYGLVVGGTELPRIVGPAFAKELLFTARVVDAEEARRIGLVNQIYAPEELLPAAIEMGKQIAANSPAAVQWAKRVVDAATVIDNGREMNAEAGRALSSSSDHTSRFREAAERVTRKSER